MTKGEIEWFCVNNIIELYEERLLKNPTRDQRPESYINGKLDAYKSILAQCDKNLSLSFMDVGDKENITENQESIDRQKLIAEEDKAYEENEPTY